MKKLSNEELYTKVINLESRLSVLEPPSKFKVGEEVCWTTECGEQELRFGVIVKIRKAALVPGLAYYISVNYTGEEGEDLIVEDRLMSALNVKLAVQQRYQLTSQ